MKAIIAMQLPALGLLNRQKYWRRSKLSQKAFFESTIFCFFIVLQYLISLLEQNVVDSQPVSSRGEQPLRLKKSRSRSSK